MLVTPDGFRVAAGFTATLQLQLLDAAGDQKNVDLGQIPTGRPRTLRAGVPCQAGCTVEQLVVSTYFGAGYSGRLAIGDVRVAGGATDLPGAAADWRPGVAEVNRVEAAAGGPGTLALRRVSDVRDRYDASIPAWSLQLGVLAAVAGLLLAALALVLLVASTWRRRSRDLACLGLSGVRRRGLGRVAVGEQLPIVLLAVLVGAGCGLLG